MSRKDVYDYDTKIMSLSDIAPELLYKLAEVSEYDKSLEDILEALEFSVTKLSEEEVKLMFFRFFHHNSYKTLKKTMSMGSTKTAAKKVIKLSKCIKEYVFYRLEQDYDEDVKAIHKALGNDAKVVAELLFLRWSKNKILRSKKIRISQARLARTILDIEIFCSRSIIRSGFWEVIATVGKLPPKIK